MNTKMAEKKISIGGELFTVRFNMACALGYERLTDTNFFSEKFDTTSSRITLCLATLVACNPEKENVAEAILQEASMPEVAELMKAVFDSLEEWSQVSILAKDAAEVKSEKEDSAKNG